MSCSDYIYVLIRIGEQRYCNQCESKHNKDKTKRMQLMGEIGPFERPRGELFTVFYFAHGSQIFLCTAQDIAIEPLAIFATLNENGQRCFGYTCLNCIKVDDTVIT